MGLCAGPARGFLPHILCASEGDKAIISPTFSAIQCVCIVFTLRNKEGVRVARIISGYLLPAPKLCKGSHSHPCAHFPGSFLESSELLWGDLRSQGFPNLRPKRQCLSLPSPWSLSAKSFLSAGLQAAGVGRTTPRWPQGCRECEVLFVRSLSLIPTLPTQPPISSDQVLFLGPNAGRENLAESPSLEGSPSTPPNPQSRDSGQAFQMLGDQVQPWRASFCSPTLSSSVPRNLQDLWGLQSLSALSSCFVFFFSFFLVEVSHTSLLRLLGPRLQHTYSPEMVTPPATSGVAINFVPTLPGSHPPERRMLGQFTVQPVIAEGAGAEAC